MNNLEKKLIATGLLIPTILGIGYLVATKQEFTGWPFWGFVIFGIVNLWVIFSNRERLPEPVITITLDHVNVPEGKMIINIWTNRKGFVAVHIDCGPERIGCEVYPIVANNTRSFDVRFRKCTTGTVVAKFYRKYPKCDQFPLASSKCDLV